MTPRRGWFEGLPDDQQQNLWHYLKGPRGESGEAAAALCAGVVVWSGARTGSSPGCAEPGADARMNVPGRVEGNWHWRCTEDTLSAAAF